MDFFVKNLFSKCEHIRIKLRIYSHSLNKSLTDMVTEILQKEFLCDTEIHFHSIKVNLYSIKSIFMISKYIFIQSKQICIQKKKKKRFYYITFFLSY